MNTVLKPISLLAVMLLTASCKHTAQEAPAVQAGPAKGDRPALQAALAKAGDPLPELAAADLKALAAGDTGKAVLDWARGAAEKKDIPETTYTLYGDFIRTGDRDSYQKPYYAKRTLLTQEVLAAWLGGDDSRMDRINDLIWSVCEESTWVLPAHDKGPETIDLFSAETGTLLASVVQLLGDRLPQHVRDRIQSEIKRRLIDLYLENGDKYGWKAGMNNWTGVCAGSVGEIFLLFEKDPERLADGLEMVIASLKRFIEKGFAPDGGCLEGIGYWNYGLKHLVIFSEMLRARTGGDIDLLSDPKLKRIAAYPLSVYLGNGKYASFSDAHEDASVNPFLAARLGDRLGVRELRDLAGSPMEWNLTGVVRGLLWWDGKKDGKFSTATVFLPDSGLARLVGESGGAPVVVAIKGGCNAEPHNHNDVGSFIVHADGEVYLCDPGGGLYSRDYFSGRRYENVFANSYGHSVPRIGEQLQKAGAQYNGEAGLVNDHTVQVRFNNAYGMPNLKELVRTVSLENGTVTLTDKAAFSSEPAVFEEALMTWQRVEVNGGEARILSKRGVLTLRAEGGVFEAEPLEKACKENHKTEMLTRLRIVHPASPQVASTIVMEYKRTPDKP